MGDSGPERPRPGAGRGVAPTHSQRSVLGRLIEVLFRRKRIAGADLPPMGFPDEDDESDEGAAETHDGEEPQSGGSDAAAP